MSRRQFLKRAGQAGAALGAAPLLPACAGGDGARASAARGIEFRRGVASGDPLSDRVILWTRVTSAAGGVVSGVVRMYRDPALREFVGEMAFTASAARDFTVKLDFAGLAPATTYYYRFEAAGVLSPVGRTRTAPVGNVSRLRFGVVSCASFAHGWFNGYAHLARRADLDAIVHLGDYIYEYGSGEYGTARPYEPAHEIVTLDDYRTRHAYYKREPDLIELHRQFPFITIWDDHESADNSWREGAVNHTEGAEGEWKRRKAHAHRAYDEWMPIRYPRSGDTGRIWRKLSYGSLVDLFLLDTRLYDRDAPAGTPPLPGDAIDPADPARRLLGPEQLAWLKDGLATSAAKWKLLGNQVVMHPWKLVGAPQDAGGGQVLNGDSWDGYQAERAELLDHLRAQRIDNVVVLTGDVHSSWAADVTDDPNNPAVYNPATGAGAVAVEYVATAITSPFAIDIPEGQEAMLANNPHIRYTDWDKKGYLLLDVTPQRLLGEWWYVSTIAERGGGESYGIGYQTADGTNRLAVLPVTSPSPAAEDPPPLAP